MMTLPLFSSIKPDDQRPKGPIMRYAPIIILAVLQTDKVAYIQIKGFFSNYYTL